MGRFLAFMTVFVLTLSVAKAEEWNSPDGLFSFTVPDGFARNSELPLEQHQLQHWSSDVHSCILTIGTAEIPKHITQIKLSAFIEGTLQQFVDENGKPLPNIKTIHSKSGQTKEGFAFCEVMTSAEMPQLNLPVSVYQYAVLINGTMYKLIFTSYDALPLEIPGIKSCIDSIKIHATPKNPSLFDIDAETPADRLSKRMGGVAFCCLLLAGIIYWFTKSRRPKTIPRQSNKEDMPFEN